MVYIQKNIVVLIAMLLITAPACALVEISGDFVEYAQYLESLVFPEFSRLYVVPTTDDLARFHALAQIFVKGNIPAADAQASALNYDLILFKDAKTHHLYYGLCEKLVDGTPTRGWGTYFINFTSSAPAHLRPAA